MAESQGDEGGGRGNPSPPPQTLKGSARSTGFGADVAAAGADAAQWIKSLASPREAECHSPRQARAAAAAERKPGAEGAVRTEAKQPQQPSQPPAGAAPHSGRWRWEPYASEESSNVPAASSGEHKDGEPTRVGGLMGFFSGGREKPPTVEVHGPSVVSSAGAQVQSARSSARSSKGFAMPCITLREDSRGNVSLFGMEPGGALQRLGTVCSGDIIVEVDGKSAVGCTEKQVRAMLVGERGSVCTIRWISPDKACGVDLADLMQKRQADESLVGTELVRDIPVGSGASLTHADLPHTSRPASSTSASTSRVSWKVSRTSARSSVGYGTLPQDEAALVDTAEARPSSWLPWAPAPSQSASRDVSRTSSVSQQVCVRARAYAWRWSGRHGSQSTPVRPLTPPIGRDSVWWRGTTEAKRCRSTSTKDWTGARQRRLPTRRARPTARQAGGALARYTMRTSGPRWRGGSGSL